MLRDRIQPKVGLSSLARYGAEPLRCILVAEHAGAHKYDTHKRKI